MKNVFKLSLVTLLLSFILAACSDGNSLVKKRITQRIDQKSMGMIKDLDIESIESVDAATFICIYNFSNPMLNKKVRLTKQYTFTTDLDSIVGVKDLKSEMESGGEWVKAGF
ncbi:hypothetical protein L3073_08710 [Ancylomarina sp. DW003]|nr:hypothetical protein [Ancylomarina sp. DW003]MDE5422289.1 hypothetical protein [Ancylomarina sp. DW003]